MKIKVKGETQKQILAGIEPFGEMEIEIALADLSEEQRVKLAEMTSNNQAILVVRAESGDVVAALQDRIDRQRAQAEKEAAARSECDATARAKCAAALIWQDAKTEEGIEYPQYHAPYLTTWGVSPEVEKLIEDTHARLRAEANALNVAAREAVAPQIEAAKAARLAREQASAEAEAARKAALFATRLETGILEINCGRGSRAEWGEPWIAKLTSRNGRRPDYDFAEGSYDLAREVLVIPCRPGETIAWGQKNYRRTKRTIHTVCKMTTSGELIAG